MCVCMCVCACVSYVDSTNTFCSKNHFQTLLFDILVYFSSYHQMDIDQFSMNLEIFVITQENQTG